MKATFSEPFLSGARFGAGVQGFIRVLAVGLMVTGVASAAESVSRSRARMIYNRVAGVSPTPAILDQMESLVNAGDNEGAAQLAMNTASFYNVTVTSWAKPFFTRDESPATGLNDGVATLVYMVANKTNAKEMLTGNYIAVADPARVPAGVTIRRTDADIYGSNRHYDDIQANIHRVNLKDLLVKAPQKHGQVNGTAFTAVDLPQPQSMGVQTSRAFSSTHRFDGTGRRETEYAFKVFLGFIYEENKVALEDSMVRWDVSRTPGGSAATYRNNCVGCHSQADSATLNGRFLNFRTNGNFSYLEHTPGVVNTKWTKNSTNNVPAIGYEVNAASRWQIRFLQPQLGWRGSKVPALNSWVEGDTPNEFGKYLADSRAFSQYMVVRVFRDICRREPDLKSSAKLDLKLVERVQAAFESGNYDLNVIFRKLAADSSCIGVAQ